MNRDESGKPALINQERSHAGSRVTETSPRHSWTWRDLPADRLVESTDLAKDWDTLNAAGLNLPFMAAYAWRVALRAWGTGNERLLVGSRGDKVEAMMIVELEAPMRWRSFQPSQIPLCAMVCAKNLDSFDFTVRALRSLSGWPMMLSLTQIDPLHMARMEGRRNRTSDYIETAWIDVVGSIDDYWASRGKNIRQNLRKQHNRLKTDGISTFLIEVTDPKAMGAAVAAYGHLESSGWKSQTGTAIAANNEQGAFYTEFLTQAAQFGEARVYQFFFDTRMVASELAVCREGVLTILKTTYDESIPKAYSAALLLREEQLRRIYESAEFRRIEFYGRRMEWHIRLTELYRVLHHSTIYRWPLLKALHKARLNAVEKGLASGVERP